MSRFLIIAIKFGIYSEAHIDILRRLYLSFKLITSKLVLFQTNNDDTDHHLENINDILEDMEIDENIFNIKAYKDQA